MIFSLVNVVGFENWKPIELVITHASTRHTDQLAEPGLRFQLGRPYTIK